MSTKTRTFFSISLVIVLIIIFHYIGWLKPIENFFQTLITPGSKALYNISIGETDENFTSVEELHTAYENLKKELLDNEVDLVKIELLTEENVKLREQLGFLEEAGWQSIGAEVIG